MFGHVKNSDRLTTLMPFNTLPVPSCYATLRKHEGWGVAGLPKPREGKSRGRGRVRTTDLPISKFALLGQPRGISASMFPSSDVAARLQLNDTTRWPKGLEREFTNRKVHGSNPTSASQFPLSRLGQPGSIPALVQPLSGMALNDFLNATTKNAKLPLVPFERALLSSVVTGTLVKPVSYPNVHFQDSEDTHFDFHSSNLREIAIQ
ncbi:hypothetical protein T265_13986, partial [Opisthorchis viverrini]